MKKVNGGFSLRGYKGKGGGSARQPVEARDSLHSVSYARVLDLLSEGPIVGLVDGLKSVYLDGTPLQNSQGGMNFSGVQFDIRHGTQQQDYIPGFPSSENTIGVGVTLRYGTPWVRAITRPELSAVRVTLGVNGLSKANTENGDLNGYRVAYAIDLQTDGGAWAEVISSAFDGKTTSQYRRTHRIDLPQGATNWAIRVRRLTPNADSATVGDTTVIDNITEVIDGKLRYPMSAIAGVQVDASQFQSIPTRAYHLRGRIIRVPTNYDPETATYSGIWDGTFKTAYSNNPAWVFYDLVTHERYGLGKQIPQAWVNKWALYRIGQYCDELVPTGRGSAMERRFTCNLYMQSQGDAFNVLRDLVGIFRGMMYWGAGAAEPVADMPRDPVYTYTQANVIDGLFTYTGSRRKDRPTTALVSYNDPTDMYRQKVVYYQDDEAVARYGIKKVELTAFGCTSESQALRVAKWALLTAKRETRNVNFSVGLYGTLVSPGSIIRVADGLLAGKRIGGRIKSATSTQIELDADLTAVPGDTITVIMPDGTAQTRTIQIAVVEKFTADSTQYTADTTQLTADRELKPGARTVVTVSPPFTDIPPPESVWAIDSDYLKTQLFTVVSVAEAGKGIFDIHAVQHEPGKFEAIDYGTKLDDRPITVVPAKEQAEPTAVSIDSYEVVSQGISSTTVAITWDKPADAVAYDIEWSRDNSDWVKVARQQTPRLEIENAYSGTYVARVRAVNSIEIPSLWTESAPTEVNGLLSAPPAIVGFNATALVFGIRLKWGYPAGLYVADHVEIRYGETNNFANAVLLGNFPYPQNTHELMGLSAAKSFFFWARIVDKNGLPGPWTVTLSGSSSSDPGEILDYLDGQISETELAQSLRTEIGKIDGLETDVTGLGTRITTEENQRIAADSALSSRIDTVAAVAGSNTAAIQTEATVRANADSALAENITTVQASANEALASAQTALTTVNETNGKLSAMYSVKVQVTSGGAYTFAGFGVGVDNSSGVLQSQFLVTADRFAILPATTSDAASAKSPFVVQNGQVFIDNAIIRDGTLNSAKIIDGTLTSAKIVDWLESDATNTLGQKVWRLNMRTGEMQFNGTGNGGRLTINNNLIQVYDANNVLRVRMGIW